MISDRCFVKCMIAVVVASAIVAILIDAETALILGAGLFVCVIALLPRDHEAMRKRRQSPRRRRYPTPGSVTIHRGLAGFSSSFRRR